MTRPGEKQPAETLTEQVPETLCPETLAATIRGNPVRPKKVPISAGFSVTGHSINRAAIIMLYPSFKFALIVAIPSLLTSS
jgi:hypothetical protein